MYSFVFHIHVSPDDDRCKIFDRQRNEIKTYDKSPPYLQGFDGETVTYRWKFKLANGFQPSPKFSHIHQLKAVGGDDGQPVITFTARSRVPERLEIGHVDSTGVRTVLTSSPLEPFKGAGVEAYERATYGHHGSYSIELKDVMSGVLILSVSAPDIDLWRNGTDFIRPKWGIYRSLLEEGYLRDEQVRFTQFCLAKGNDDC